MSTWSERRARALALASDTPHAADILRCYAAVTGVQEAIAERVPIAAWLPATQSDDADGPALRLGRVPVDEALTFFDDVLARMADVGTAVMIADARRLASAGEGDRRRALQGSLGGLDRDDADVRFHARAFGEVVATTLAGRVLPALGAPEEAGPASCRVCGAPPAVATLRDLPGALGSRGLVCSRCGCEQRMRRLVCAYCGESHADRLRVHTPESVPHVRIDECGSCRTYMKTVDLRRRGDAVPIVEDLATPELDLWAQDQGLARAHKNLFGM